MGKGTTKDAGGRTSKNRAIRNRTCAQVATECMGKINNAQHAIKDAGSVIKQGALRQWLLARQTVMTCFFLGAVIEPETTVNYCLIKMKTGE